MAEENSDGYGGSVFRVLYGLANQDIVGIISYNGTLLLDSLVWALHNAMLIVAVLRCVHTGFRNDSS